MLALAKCLLGRNEINEGAQKPCLPSCSQGPFSGIGTSPSIINLSPMGLTGKSLMRKNSENC